MTEWVAFLRAVNVGKRKMKMAELKSVCEALGFADVKTILASGNVRFTADADPKQALEAEIERHWGWSSEAILRTRAELEAMVDADPFAAFPEDGPWQRYVMLFDAPLPEGSQFAGSPGDYEIVAVTAREIFLVGHRQPDGRHGPGLDKFDRQLEKGTVATTRNWKTIPRVLT
ncbi:DUF1697 domain-containing protein [Devosia sp.]|uniref:DUF1697 domain-containing protein n=1 Tax=Devosia sp. TaxID=1871048 RepID=UPI003A900A2E